MAEERSHSRGRGCWKPRGGGPGGPGGHGQHFERVREAMLENREAFDRNLAKLSPDAQKYAIQIREIIEDRDKSAEQCREEIRAIKQGVSQDIHDELDDHKHRMMREMRRDRGEGGEEGAGGGWGGKRSRGRRQESN